jgi:hypothetical protein
MHGEDNIKFIFAAVGMEDGIKDKGTGLNGVPGFTCLRLLLENTLFCSQKQ